MIRWVFLEITCPLPACNFYNSIFQAITVRKEDSIVEIVTGMKSFLKESHKGHCPKCYCSREKLKIKATASSYSSFISDINDF